MKALKLILEKKSKKIRERQVKLPKKIKILNKTFDILRGDKYLGYFHFNDKDNNGKPTIYINDKKDDEVVLEVFMHETMEIVLELTKARYERPDEQDNFVFYYSHKEHDIMSKIMGDVVGQLLKIQQ